MDDPVHWTQHPFDGRPVSGFGPAQDAGSTPPSAPPEGSNTGLIAVIAVVVVAVLGFAVVAHPWSHPKRKEQAVTDTGGFLDAEEIATTTVPPATAKELGDRLPTATTMRNVTREGVAVGTFNARWVADREGPLEPAEDAKGGGCNAVEGVEAAYERNLVLAPPGTKGEMGDYGQVLVIGRRFGSPAQAQKWVAAHDGQPYLDCTYVNDHQDSVKRLKGPIVEDAVERTTPVGRGRAHRYHVTYTLPDGHHCTIYQDAYYNQAGSFGLATVFRSCGLPLDPIASRAVVTQTLASLTDLGTPAS